jgi:hypothetical protein
LVFFVRKTEILVVDEVSMLSAALLQKTNDILQAVRVSICFCLVDKRYFSKKYIDRPKCNSIGADIHHIPHVVTLRGCIAKR